MLILGDDLIDYLPSMFFLLSQDTRTLLTNIDLEEPLTQRERLHIEGLIRSDLENNRREANHELHPQVEEMLPLVANRQFASQSRSILMQEIEKFEQEQREEDDQQIVQDGIIRDGIDTARYNVFKGETTEDNEKFLLAALSYASMERRQLEMQQEHQKEIRESEERCITSISIIKDDYESAFNQKRKMLETIDGERKRRQVEEFEPLNTHLSQRWKESIRSIVDIGAETLNIQGNSD